jgi:hypothetical protein
MIWLRARLAIAVSARLRAVEPLAVRADLGDLGKQHWHERAVGMRRTYNLVTEWRFRIHAWLHQVAIANGWSK